jgi:quinohemoprotein ethanol dehydrogenase
VLDGSLVALDQKTGRLAWRTQLEDYHDGFSITGAPRYFDGFVFTGMSGAENGIRGRIYALDAKTGREVWRFYNIPAPGEPFSETWPSPNDPNPIAAQAWMHGGASVWQSPAIDPELGMMYYSTGNGAPTGGGFVRAGDNLFAASIVALDYKTGQYKWHFQEVHHDIWDYDAPSPVVLFDQTYNGVMRKGLYQCGKTGWCYFLDRTNGQPLVGITEEAVVQEPRQLTSPTQPKPVGDPFVPVCSEPLPNFPVAGCNLDGFWDVPKLMPASSGNWSPTSYHVPTGYVFVMGGQALTARATHFVEYERGKRYSSSASVTPPDSPIKNTLTALDSRTNKIVWQHTRDGDRSYGAVSTGGGLVFVGQIDGNLVGLDARTGDELWKFQTGWGISAPPITYAVNGVQYVAVASGGNRGGVTTLDGDAVWAFALNGTIDEIAAPPPIQTKASVGGALIHMGEMVGGVRALVTTGGDVVFDGTISTEDYLFNPVRVGIPVGTTLTWNNRGSVIHTATDNKAAWDTSDIPSGESRSVTFNTAGTYNYSCNPHPWMLGQIVVQ